MYAHTHLFWVTWVHVPTISVWDFQRLSASDWNSCFISNHMLRNLGRALLSVFSSVSVEIALWRHVFLGLDGFSCRLRGNCPVASCIFGIRWFFMPIIVFFQSVLRNTLLFVNVNWNYNVVGLVFGLQTEFGAQIEILPFR
jgi:hypothetical protein